MSYSIVLAAALLICRLRHVPLVLRRPRSLSEGIAEVIRKGFPSGIVQAGYAVTTAFCNYFMNRAFQAEGVIAMSLFAQMDSVISIALISDPDDAELGTIYRMTRLKRDADPSQYLLYIPDETSRSRIELLHDVRNALAHGQPCAIGQVADFIDGHPFHWKV